MAAGMRCMLPLVLVGSEKDNGHRRRRRKVYSRLTQEEEEEEEEEEESLFKADAVKEERNL